MDDWPIPVEAPDTWPVTDLVRERIAQRLEFGDAADDALLPAEWIARLTKHLGRAVTTDPDEYRTQIVICGALCLAALEAFDRRYGTQEPAA